MIFDVQPKAPSWFHAAIGPFKLDEFHRLIQPGSIIADTTAEEQKVQVRIFLILGRSTEASRKALHVPVRCHENGSVGDGCDDDRLVGRARRQYVRVPQDAMSTQGKGLRGLRWRPFIKKNGQGWSILDQAVSLNK